MDSFPEIEITEYSIFDGRDSDCGNTLNISYGIDENYLDGVGVSIASVLLHNNIDVAFHVICDRYSQDFIKKVAELAVQFHVKISLYTINVTCLAVLPRTEVWSRAMYFRLFAFDYLSSKIERLLYLDADVICKGPLDLLLQLDLTDNVAAVVKDVESIQNRVDDRLSAYHLQGRYFNSGVVLVNLSAWKKDALTAKALALLTADNSSLTFKYPDQDVLNILLSERVIYLPREYNTIYTLKSELRDKTHRKYLELINDETKLIHYTGATKPWHAWAIYPSAVYYKKALQQSPWRACPAKQAKTLVEFKKRYKHLLVQRRYIAGLAAGLAYLRRKLFSH
ncbi:glycosyltransferase family 8 protein [Intestinirhabdus alba]|uniref:Lipopolysaccharide 1,2-glucosyltransferase n=1 Tax=Intestinirhabdus alba TaxID=2899544 RepID=A0A6L6IFI2_9ENTR|nr:lipopolysaccharide 1,2-glucosyltransferase [Intestinirhabdus alba]